MTNKRKRSGSPSLRFWSGSLAIALLVALVMWLVGGVDMILGNAQEDNTATTTTATSPKAPATVTLKGSVHDGESRAGIADVQIVLEGKGAPITATTDSRGQFAVELPRDSGTWSVKANASGYTSQADAEATVEAQPGASTRLHLWQRGTILGKVVYQGEPVQNARLSLLRLSGQGIEEPEVKDLELTTEPDGTFTLTTPPGRVRVLADAPGYAVAESRELQIHGGRKVEGIVLDLTPRGNVVVSVVNEEKTPVPSARVEVLGIPTWQIKAPLTDSEGKANITNIPSGEARFRITAQGYSITETEAIAIKADDTAEITAVLPTLKGVFGRVVNPAKEPVRGASVMLRPVETPTSIDRTNSQHGGHFRFEGLDVGVYELSASHPRFGSSTTIRIDTDDLKAGVVLELTTGGSISGRVVSSGREPVLSFSVVVEKYLPESASSGQEIGPRHFGARSFENRDGAFSLNDLGPGTYDLYVDGGDLGSGRTQGVRVEAGRKTSGVTIELEEGALVTGRVTDEASGNPVPKAHVMLSDNHRISRGLRGRATTTDTDGNFVIRGIASGRRSLRVAKKGYNTTIRAGIVLDRGDELDLEIALVATEEGKGPKVEFFGIGAVLQTTPAGTIQVKSTLEGGPGERFGLQANDEILRVDDQDVSTLGLGRTVELIRGEEGAGLELEIRRKGDPYPFKVDLERGRVVYEERR